MCFEPVSVALSQCRIAFMRLVVAGITLVVIMGILLLERSLN